MNLTDLVLFLLKAGGRSGVGGERERGERTVVVVLIDIRRDGEGWHALPACFVRYLQICAERELVKGV